MGHSKSLLPLFLDNAGNADGLGPVRRLELVEACGVHGIPEDRVRVVEHASLQDGMTTHWPPVVVARAVEEAWPQDVRADLVLTFDQDGVSGHPNHRAVWEGVLLFAAERRGPARSIALLAPAPAGAAPSDVAARRRSGLQVKAGAVSADDEAAAPLLRTPPTPAPTPALLRVLTLETTGMLRKYIGAADAVLSMLLSPCCCVAMDPWRAWQAMAAHRSQFVWYRKLFVVFSRYVYVNTFRLCC
ncbi:unnamed protein product [Phaeothamnion confervicola]